MADFTTWERATLEQFAQEATAKLIENREAIEELVESLSYSISLVEHLHRIFHETGSGISFIEQANTLIEKHTTTKEQ